MFLDLTKNSTDRFWRTISGPQTGLWETLIDVYVKLSTSEGHLILKVNTAKDSISNLTGCPGGFFCS